MIDYQRERNQGMSEFFEFKPDLWDPVSFSLSEAIRGPVFACAQLGKVEPAVHQTCGGDIAKSSPANSDDGSCS